MNKLCLATLLEQDASGYHQPSADSKSDRGIITVCYVTVLYIVLPILGLLQWWRQQQSICVGVCAFLGKTVSLALCWSTVGAWTSCHLKSCCWVLLIYHYSKCSALVDVFFSVDSSLYWFACCIVLHR